MESLCNSATGIYPGIQIIDLSDPTQILASDSLHDTSSLALYVTRSVDIFQTYGSSNTYAITADSSVSDEGGLQIIDLSDPANIVAKDSITYGDGIDEMYNAYSVRTWTNGTKHMQLLADISQMELEL